MRDFGPVDGDPRVEWLGPGVGLDVGEDVVGEDGGMDMDMEDGSLGVGTGWTVVGGLLTVGALLRR